MNNKKINPQVKTILELLGKGILISSLFIFPGAAAGIGAVYKIYKELNRKKELNELEKFNLSRLRYVLGRLHEQKIIETSEENGYSIVKLTERGRLKVLKYKLEEMTITKPPRWDGQWRMILYDISKIKRNEQEAFRRFLKGLNFLQMHKSVYLYPYPCEKEITFLKEYFGIGEEVIYVIAKSIDNEEVYKRYFGL